MSAPTKDDLTANALLAKLTEADRNRLAPHMLAFKKKPLDILQQAGQEVLHTWFPCGSALAAFCVGTNHNADAVEVALIGREGAIGGIVSNGHVPAYTTAQVRFGGRFLRIKTSALEQAKLDFDHAAPLVLALFRLPPGAGFSGRRLQRHTYDHPAHRQMAAGGRQSHGGQ